MGDEILYHYLEVGLAVLTLSILVYHLPCYIILFVLFPLALKVYTKLTVGVCRSLQRLDGKTAIVTGANAGIGLETAKDFARRGAKVILACRSLERGKAAVDEIQKETGNTKIVLKQLDLCSLASVRKFCKEINAEETRLDILVNNAGMVVMEKVITVDNLETIFQVNHFANFLLTNLLLDLMSKTGKARIVMVSSMMNMMIRNLDLDNLNSEKDWSAFKVYARTKLANILFTKELHRRLQAAGHGSITVNALHPGGIRTNIMHDSEEIWYFRIINPIQRFFFKNIVEGAQTTIYVAVSEDVAEVSGEYFSDCEKSCFLSTLAKDSDLAKQLWEKSVQSVALKQEDTIVW